MTGRAVVLDGDGTPITPELVLEAYRRRCFPMADSRHGRFHWYRPQVRAVLSWDRITVPRSLRKVAAKQPYRITMDRAFERVIAACADRSETWICRDIEALYLALHQRSQAHSVEAWDGDELVGGLYGLVLGGVFCGESMFHRRSDASKLCVLHLLERLQACGFGLLDCQQQSAHMGRFGAYEISDDAYAELLAQYSAERRLLASA
ncbi:MAG: leucyl/phenylalanyl-tRNA--protein transferase [Planctomycetota bacterium]|jgi:leucyl/phenylalanyl-tRNA--protein transferase|nr:leucyl/phenylalanyl-tRNA--protein transferase [Planctomycetota bacterium]